MLFFGVVGYLMRRFSYSTAAFIIAFILGRGAEESLRQAMLLSSSGPLVFFEKPVSLVFLIIGLSVFLFRAITSYRRSRTHITA
jgi:putative tricarboxylic transport membrane protein